MKNADNQFGAVHRLYPASEPYHCRIMDMPGDHRIYVEECGNPEGLPAIVLHGGPGGGCSPVMRRFFDPQKYRVVLFDQRGCGRSRPHASVANNTTWDLVADIERIRESLGIDHWVVFGGSWGATLALIYAQTHPERARHLVLRGVFLMTNDELQWFYGGGAASFFPDQWQAFIRDIPIGERGDLIAAYHKRLFCDEERIRTSFARTWTDWESALAVLVPRFTSGGTPSAYARAFARIENHYFLNRGFLEKDGQILQNMDKIAHIPGDIIQGRYDMICPPKRAFELHDLWPASRLEVIPTAGHSLMEPGVSTALVAALDNLHR
jgi:proline iminopeptidase